MFHVQHSLLTWTSPAFGLSPVSGIELMLSRQRSSQHSAPVSTTLRTISPVLLLKKSDRGIAVTGMWTALVTSSVHPPPPTAESICSCVTRLGNSIISAKNFYAPFCLNVCYSMHVQLGINCKNGSLSACMIPVCISVICPFMYIFIC